MALALHTPWAPHTSDGFCSAHSMGSAPFPWLLLCTLHGFRTLPKSFALHTPWVPYTTHGFCSGHRSRTLSPWLWLAHSSGAEHSHRLYCVVPRRHITQITFPFCDCPVQEAQRHVKPPPHDSGWFTRTGGTAVGLNI